jgi:hypothetical protein
MLCYVKKIATCLALSSTARYWLATIRFDPYQLGYRKTFPKQINSVRSSRLLEVINGQ